MSGGWLGVLVWRGWLRGRVGKVASGILARVLSAACAEGCRSFASRSAFPSASQGV